jgi:hypothetical protein
VYVRKERQQAENGHYLKLNLLRFVGHLLRQTVQSQINIPNGEHCADEENAHDDHQHIRLARFGEVERRLAAICIVTACRFAGWKNFANEPMKYLSSGDGQVAMFQRRLLTLITYPAIVLFALGGPLPAPKQPKQGRENVRKILTLPNSIDIVLKVGRAPYRVNGRCAQKNEFACCAGCVQLAARPLRSDFWVAFRVHKSMTTSSVGCEQQTRRLPLAGFSSGCGS